MLRLFSLLFICCLPISSFANSLQQLENELKNQQYSRAATTGLTLLREQPDNTRAVFLTALAFQYNNQPRQAQRYYQQIIQSHPELPEPRNNLAMIYLQQGQHDEAVDLLIESLNTHPAYATAWQNLSNLYRGLASEAYRKALSEENNANNVLDSIQLTALTHLHSLPEKSQTIQQASISLPPPVPSKSTQKAQREQSSPLKQQLAQTIKEWANNWSNKNFEAYISAYTESYKGNKANHLAWVEYRRTRIKRPGNLQVTLSNIHIKSHNNAQAIIDFDQSYQSPNYRDKIRKRINLIKTDNGWKISRERTLAVL